MFWIIKFIKLLLFIIILLFFIFLLYYNVNFLSFSILIEFLVISVFFHIIESYIFQQKEYNRSLLRNNLFLSLFSIGVHFLGDETASLAYNYRETSDSSARPGYIAPPVTHPPLFRQQLLAHRCGIV